MICKFCNAQIDDGSAVCPVCNMVLAEEEPTMEPVTQEETLPTAEETLEEAVEVAPAEEATEDTLAEATAVSDSLSEGEEQADGELSAETEPSEAEISETEPSKTATAQKKVWPWVLAAVGAVLVLCALAVVLLLGMGIMEIKVPTNDIFCKESYTLTDEAHTEDGDTVVATMGDAKLTNKQLQIYYRMQVMDFLNYFGSYLSQIGMDAAKPLSEQTCYYDETMTWEQYFIDAAIKTWQSYQSMALEAAAAGFTLDAELEAELAKIPEALEEQAVSGQYASADALVKELLGPACTVEDYMEYVRLSAVSNEYYTTVYEQILPSDEEVEAYFTENEASFTQSGVTRDGGLTSSVRHILVCPKAEEVPAESTPATEPATTEPTAQATEPTEAAGQGGFTDAQWADCLAEAERILQEWKDGDATEESFAALVATYTEDPGSASTGGLYEGINPTSSYVENFLNWSVDPARQPGDTGIVQTEYGYHIMYFVSGTPYWKEAAREQLTGEKTTELLEDFKDAHPMKVVYKKIVLAPLELA